LEGELATKVGDIHKHDAEDAGNNKSSEEFIFVEEFAFLAVLIDWKVGVDEFLFEFDVQ
jgi:hypothetical protein